MSEVIGSLGNRILGSSGHRVIEYRNSETQLASRLPNPAFGSPMTR
jgi:hypothetical protein